MNHFILKVIYPSLKPTLDSLQFSLPRFQQQLTRAFLTNKTIIRPISNEHLFATQYCRLDLTFHRLTLIGTALVPEEHGARLHNPLGSIVKDTDVSIEADGQVAFLLLESDLRRGIDAAPPDNIGYGIVGGREASSGHLCP